jgi:hypothetical protein
MKMLFAGFAGDPETKPENVKFNCLRNRSCQNTFFVPVAALCDFMLYFELPFLPTTYAISIIDYCTGVTHAVTVANYVTSSHTSGFYAVFSGLTSALVPETFYLKVSFFNLDELEAVYYSQDFEIVTCEPLTVVTACYNDPTKGSEAFDNNGVYYGFPLGEFLGNDALRYYHFISLRKGSIIGTKTKLSLNTFNFKKITKTATTKQYNFESELVPEFMKDEIISVIARGNLKIAGKMFQVDEEVELSANDNSSKLWAMDIPLVENINTIFSCRLTDCTINVCDVLPVVDPVECCAPSDVTAEVQEVTVDTGAGFVFRYYSSVPNGRFANITDACAKINQTGFNSIVFYIDPSALSGGELIFGGEIFKDAALTVKMPDPPGFIGFAVVRNLATGTETAVDLETNNFASTIHKENC